MGYQTWRQDAKQYLDDNEYQQYLKKKTDDSDDNTQKKMNLPQDNTEKFQEGFRKALGYSEGGQVANTFDSMKPNTKESYSDGKKDKFKRTKTLIQPNGKATAELDASKDPMGFIEKTKNMKIGKKGFAF